MTNNSDPDQREVYLAEGRANLSNTTLRLRDTSHARQCLDSITNDPLTRKFFPDLPRIIEVKFTANRTTSWATHRSDLEPRIGLGVYGRDLYTLIHEVAHHACGTDGHGREFRYALTWLVRRHLTIFDWAALTYELRAANLSYLPH